MQTIGVIGGGQLGRMMALDAKRMGYDVIVLDPADRSPCGQVADEQIVAGYDDLDAMDELGRRTDVVTYEFENIAIAAVERLERNGYRVMPGSHVLAVTQDRLNEKQFARDCGIPTAEFAAVSSIEDIEAAATSVGFPAVLKTVRGGYDGKGQWRVTDLPSARAAFAQANGAALIWEAFVPFVKELSVVATRADDDSVIAFSPGENVHDAGILIMTIAPARVSDVVAARACEIAKTIGRRLNVVGTYCIEFFLTADGALLVNEIAPRPHNSGHYTIDATPCSQYEQHVRAICGLPLSQPRLRCNAIMLNILGTGTGNHLDGTAELLRDPSIVLHVYGKHHAVNRRKMGHFTMLVDGPVGDEDIARAHAARATLRWVE
ncbi:MAG TPA: 5-(carboxyamino)imidazole ribonucleotide synthase [Verrucomicrobiae bacterium]|nr:5-(carboxyamino)imidazole ribonucleotide synthase [Verrucomicrobiae bacterium]